MSYALNCQNVLKIFSQMYPLNAVFKNKKALRSDLHMQVFPSILTREKYSLLENNFVSLLQILYVRRLLLNVKNIFFALFLLLNSMNDIFYAKFKEGNVHLFSFMNEFCISFQTEMFLKEIFINVLKYIS